jgi:hypothetical protein
MPILNDATAISARVGRAKTNALTVTLQTANGDEVGAARQHGGAGVLFGFKNGGRGGYTLTAPNDVLEIAVAATTTVTRAGQPVGAIVPADGGARIDDAGGTTLAVLRPYVGAKGDDGWAHPLLSPSGAELGSLTYMRSHAGWGTLIEWTVMWDRAGAALKAPSAGALLTLAAPVPPILGDLLAAACVDMSVLPRGYITELKSR